MLCQRPLSLLVYRQLAPIAAGGGLIMVGSLRLSHSDL